MKKALLVLIYGQAFAQMSFPRNFDFYFVRAFSEKPSVKQPEPSVVVTLDEIIDTNDTKMNLPTHHL